jgi:hypothetical protein
MSVLRPAVGAMSCCALHRWLRPAQGRGRVAASLLRRAQIGGPVLRAGEKKAVGQKKATADGNHHYYGGPEASSHRSQEAVIGALDRLHAFARLPTHSSRDYDGTQLERGAFIVAETIRFAPNAGI